MKISLKKCSTLEEYESFILSEDYTTPNVSWIPEDIKVYYNKYVPETRIIAKFEISDISLPTEISGFNPASSIFSKIEIDGISLTILGTTFLFSTTGEHTIKYTLVNLDTLPFYAFHGLDELKSIIIPDNVINIDGSTFGLSENLTEVKLPKLVETSVDLWYGFDLCHSLELITLPKNITEIGNSAFCECYLLSSIAIPNTVTAIGPRAFKDCTGLTTITLGENITSISYEAFDNCDVLEKIVIKTITPPELIEGEYGELDWFETSLRIEVPSQSVNIYKTTPKWSSYASLIYAIS